MDNQFNIVLLEGAIVFIENLDEKAREKILYNLKKSTHSNDPKLFKKLNDTIWEFRTLYNKKQYRLFAFWDKREKQNTLVVSTHGIIKKTDKVPLKEIKKAEAIRKEYFKR